MNQGAGVRQVRPVVVGALLVFAAASVLVDCQSAPGESDAGPDVTTGDAVVTSGFALSFSPSHVTLDSNETVKVTIDVNRAASFTDPVAFTVTTAPGLSATQPVPAVGTSSTFNLTADNGPPVGAVIVTVIGTGGTFMQSATLDVLYGSALTLDGGTFVVPTFANGVMEVKVWGGGGGRGADCSSGMKGSGAWGGGGGFARGLLTVTGGEAFAVTIGTGGTSPTVNCGGGGAGGGFSAFAASDGGLLIVGGGGGGGGGGAASGSGSLGGIVGGGGGGAAGGSSGNTMCLANGGTAGAGGTVTGGNCLGINGSPGLALQGGAGGGTSSSSTTAGNPGGGLGGGGTGGGGGGGGGYYGGSGGNSFDPSFTANARGGGGGSGWVSPNLDGGSLTTGGAPTAANATDIDYGADAGAGGLNSGGGPGRVVVRLPKP